MSSEFSQNFAASKWFTAGYGLIEDFVDTSTLTELKAEMNKLVENFEPDSINSPSIFIAGTHQNSDQYFLQSGDKIRYFLEKNVINEAGQLTVPKERSLNKIGHALHWFNPVFKRFTFQQKFKDLAKAIGLKDPVVVQSMIIFKNPQIGGEVVEHQDASYLHTLPQPNGAVVGFWIPLEDATPANGCLEFSPGSHQTVPLATRWVRTVDAQTGAISMVHTNPDVKSYNSLPFVAVPAKAGSCVVIDGLVVHRSAPNRSAAPRPIYTFHMFDRDGGQREWDCRNWLQPTEVLPFPSLYDN